MKFKNKKRTKYKYLRKNFNKIKNIMQDKQIQLEKLNCKNNFLKNTKDKKMHCKTNIIKKNK